MTGPFTGDRPLPRPLAFEDPLDARVFQRLRFIGEGPASFYADAVRLMSVDCDLRSVSHLVGHLLREIESALRDVLALVPTTADQVGEGAGGKHKAAIHRICDALDLPADDAWRRAWLAASDKLHRWAHRSALGAPRPVDDEFRQHWQALRSVFDGVLDRFEGRYLAVHSTLQALLVVPSPTREHLRTLRERVPANLITQRDFFDNLQQPGWVQALRQDGFFSQPPPVEPGDQPGYVSIPVWPPARYLKRMAHVPSAQEQVRLAITELPPTDNVRVHEDLLDAAKALPPAMAATLVPKVEEWFAGPYSLALGLPERIADLVVHLASGGQRTEAMRLARMLLDLRPDAQGDLARRDDRVRYPPWRYARLIETVRGPLLTVAGGDVLDLLCDLLDRSIRGDARSLDLASARDLSHVWHPDLDRDPHVDGRGVLVTAVRDTARSLVQVAPAAFDDVLARLKSHPPGVFTRIALDLLRVDGDLRPDLVEDTLANLGLVWAWGPHREYRMLLAARFGSLSDTTQQQILHHLDGPPPDAMEEDRAERWRFAVLSAVGDSLPTEWRARRDALAARFGIAPSPDDVAARFEVMAGDPAPLTAEEVAGMEIPALVRYLRDWTPTRGWGQPTPVGLGHSLRAAVKTDPARYAAHAADFEGLDPTYVRSFVDGLGLALKEQAVFDWKPVLELCEWACDQPREPEPRQRDDWDRDPGWRDARQRIASLLDDGMGSETNPISWELREPLWRVLARLADDPDPLSRVIADDQSHMDPATAAINSVRGEALLAAIRYGLWIRDGLVKNAGRRPEDVGFADMPELRKVLDHHVDPSRDSALPIRAVFGWRFDALVALDRAWVRDHMDDIFPPSAEGDVPADAAWCAYVVFNHPRRWTFDLLELQYRRAIGHLGRARAGRTWAAEPDFRLADHIIACCWSGWADNDLVDAFFSAASDAVRARAFRTAGEALQKTTENVPDEILHRLVRCWERRWDATSRAPREHVEERAAFGWLFAAGRFEEDWAMRKLLDAIQSVGKVEPVEEVLTTLATQATRRPREVATALRGMVEGEQEPWMPLVHRDVIREILSTAFASGDEPARDLAREVINRLAARGHRDFVDLLSRTTRRDDP